MHWHKKRIYYNSTHLYANYWKGVTNTTVHCKLSFFFINFVSLKNTIGATIKDTRTKSRGRVEVGEGGGTGWGGVEGWGENADNYN